MTLPPRRSAASRFLAIAGVALLHLLTYVAVTRINAARPASA